MKENQIYLGDCLDVMSKIKDESISLIFADLPYGTTACKWDIKIPFDKLWEQFHRIIKKDGNMVFTASQPFTSVLVASNIKNFRYEFIWEKSQGTNPMVAKKQILKKHENVLVFYKKHGVYNPQMTEGKPYKGFSSDTATIGEVYNKGRSFHRENKGTRYPTSIIHFPREYGLHPTQKPLPLMEYIVKTFSNEDDLVLDPTCGSGTTLLACKNTNRCYIGIEKEEEYYKKSIKRLEDDIYDVLF